ncbi:Substrate-specific component BioY of biotin ECF transporter [Candidatus Rhodobacter oscarellae]|uniref:Biotin transporter n=1 Tax=Candidatus Rhodobacter oscarellae TaxID=1675527 RepID=A0A0J9E338_9RHOB|nr:biotin transporter BioY [Candidatus Rhodobacter lobularis]KMW57155.1 Substrate-specific component BioY of biotin ECF transporter [Candidatus Rhodobacter lobularis]
MTLSHALFPSMSRLTQVLLVLGGAAVIAVAAQISVNIWPVSMTLQTLAILAIGFAYGARLGGATLVTYLGYGAMGLPVFSKGMNGVAFFGPTAGFLVGFVFMAILAGMVTDRGQRSFAVLAITGVVLSAMIYIPGVAWAMGADAMLGLDTSKWGADSFASIWTWYMSPFIIGDAVKAVIAALIVSGAWVALKKRA